MDDWSNYHAALKEHDVKSFKESNEEASARLRELENTPEAIAKRKAAEPFVALLSYMIVFLIFAYFNVTQQLEYLSLTFEVGGNYKYVVLGIIFSISIAIGIYLDKKKNIKNGDQGLPFLIQYMIGYCFISVISQVVLGFNPGMLYISFLTYLSCFAVVGWLAFGLLAGAQAIFIVLMITFIVMLFNGSNFESTIREMKSSIEDDKLSLKVKDWDAWVVNNRKLCNDGDASGCTNLGVSYIKGFGVDKDMPKAITLFKKGCDGNNMTGCYNLAALYAEGNGVKHNILKAFQIFRKTCDVGFMDGCVALGMLYKKGAGVAQDKQKAVELFHKACNGGNKDGCNKIKKK